jgi:uncharacterized alkaline shock family protein YloU
MTSTTGATSESQGQSAAGAGGASTPAVRQQSATPANRSELVTDQGKTSIADSVVAKIAGISCREVSGVHDMGGGVSRAFGAIKEKMPIGSSDPSPSRGVNVEVGERQAAVDLDIVIEYGAAIVDVADAIRRNVVKNVEAMTGLEVTEVNVTVDDVFVGETEDQEPRVQ